jgi:hypothetical protein
MEMQQMMECLLAKMEVKQAEVNTKMDANQTKTDNNQEVMDVNLKEMREEIKSGEVQMKSTVNAFQEKMDASIANRKDDRKETTFCQETTEARLECEKPTSAGMKACQETTVCHEATDTDTEKTEPDRGIMQSVAEHQVSRKEDAVVKPVKGRKKRLKGRKPAAR